MNKKIIVIIIIAIVAIGAIYLLSKLQNNSNQNNQTENTMDTNNSAQDLKIEVLAQGSGVEAKDGDMVTVNYTGTLVDGTKFDSNVDPEFKHVQPFQFTIGPKCRLNNTCVIEGWNLGVTGMKPGEKRKLTVPAELGYGARGAGASIPPNATLIFEVELLKIN